MYGGGCADITGFTVLRSKAKAFDGSQGCIAILSILEFEGSFLHTDTDGHTIVTCLTLAVIGRMIVP